LALEAEAKSESTGDNGSGNSELFDALAAKTFLFDTDIDAMSEIRQILKELPQQLFGSA
jgi:hypothetical protein